MIPMKLTVFIPKIIRHPNESNCVEIRFDKNSSLQHVLKDVLQDRYDLIFNSDGSCKGFAKCYYNDNSIENLSDVHLSDGDEFEIITSMSGG